MTDKPVTREEKYLAYLTDDYTGELPKPITRKEKYLYELCLKGIGGEISPEEIKNAVNEYLEKSGVGQPTDEQTNSAVSSWLNEHPEATTTVQDGSIEEIKINKNFLPWIKKDYVTPEMFGAKGDGVTDDTNAIQSMFNSKASVIFFPKGIYNISKTITITTSCSIKGCSPHSYGSTRLKYVGTEGNKSLIYIENAIVSIEDIEIHGSSCSVKKSDNKGTDGNPALYYIYVEKIPEINGIEFGKNVFGSLVKNVTLLQCSGIGLKSGVFCKLDGINAEYCNLGVYVNTDTQIINCRTSYCKNGYIFQKATQGVNIRADEIVEVGLTLLDTTFIKNCFVDQIGYCGIKLDGCRDSNIEVGVLRCGTYYYQTNYKNVPDDEKWKSCVIAIDGLCHRNNISINARSYWDLDDDGVTNMTKYGLFHLLDGGSIQDTTITLNQANIEPHLSAIKSYAIENFFSFKGIIKSLKINTTWGEFRYFNYDIPNGINGVRYINNFRYANVFDPKSAIPEFIGAMVRFGNKLYISYSDYNDSTWFRLNIEND